MAERGIGIAMLLRGFGGGLETVCEDAYARLPPHDLSGPKLEADKVKVDLREVAPAVYILAVDDLRLLRVQHQLAGHEAVGNRAPECPPLLHALTVTDDVVRVPLERDVRTSSHHPHVERIVQK
jgi:hypothetical protein